jgi:hypothetical protein
VNDADNKEIGSIVLDMKKWCGCITSASYHDWHGRRIIKIHVTRKNASNKYPIYFGRVSDGVYPVTLNDP